MGKLVQIVEVTAKYFPSDEEIAYHLGMTPERAKAALAQAEADARLDYEDFHEVTVSVRIEEIDEEDE